LDDIEGLDVSAVVFAESLLVIDVSARLLVLFLFFFPNLNGAMFAMLY